MLKLLADECIPDKLLINKLKNAGHDVITVKEADLIRKPDHKVFEVAISLNRMVITINCADFVELAKKVTERENSHPGILLVYRYNVPGKEMSHDEIVKAITNLENTGIDLKNSCHKLNDCNY